jgi:DNA-binding response OmpR family regulator
MFEEDALLKHYLTANQRLTEQQVSAIIDYSLDQKISFDEALVNLKFLTCEQLGQALAEIHRMPYIPLLEKPPSPFCKKMVPLKLTEKWKIFPVGFDAQEDLLTIAIGSPDQIKPFMRLEQKLFAHHRLTFSIASGIEIEKAVTAYYRIDASSGESAPEVPDDFNIITIEETTWSGLSLGDEGLHDDKKILLLETDIDKGKALRALLRREGYRRVTWVSSDQEAQRIIKEGAINKIIMSEAARHRTARWISTLGKGLDAPRVSYYRSIAPLVLGQELPYQTMSESLAAFIEMMVKERLQGDVARLRETQERVRYCQLLALRLQLSPVHVDGAILAAWLYDKEPFRRWLACFSAAYRLESLLDEIDHPGAKMSVESKILITVLHLLDLKRKQPAACNDVQRVRSQLRERCGAAVGDSLIEALLHLLQDEAFISRIDTPAAHIVIIDADLKQDSSLVLRLTNDGYDVAIVHNAQDALNLLNSKEIDCLISEVNLGDVDGIQLCKNVKKHPSFASLPFIFVAATQDQRLMAECLRAGADDFLTKPVDLEVLSLKLNRILSKKLGHDSRVGIKGTLSQMSFADLVQILSSSLKCVKITFTTKQMQGELYMNQGEIVHAVQGAVSGETAFYRLMRISEGEFEVVPWSSFPQKTINLSVMGLLMEGARLDDEMARTVNQ